jgi:hypothetical protein
MIPGMTAGGGSALVLLSLPFQFGFQLKQK